MPMSLRRGNVRINVISHPKSRVAVLFHNDFQSTPAMTTFLRLCWFFFTLSWRKADVKGQCAFPILMSQLKAGLLTFHPNHLIVNSAESLLMSSQWINMWLGWQVHGQVQGGLPVPQSPWSGAIYRRNRPKVLVQLASQEPSMLSFS